MTAVDLSTAIAGFSLSYTDAFHLNQLLLAQPHRTLWFAELTTKKPRRGTHTSVR